MDKLLKAGIESKLNKLTNEAKGDAKKVLKARPSCQPQEQQAKMATQLKYRGIEEWNRKLQNMYTILTATEGLGKWTAAYVGRATGPALR